MESLVHFNWSALGLYGTKRDYCKWSVFSDTVISGMEHTAVVRSHCVFRVNEPYTNNHMVVRRVKSTALKIKNYSGSQSTKVSMHPCMCVCMCACIFVSVRVCVCAYR